MSDHASRSGLAAPAPLSHPMAAGAAAAPSPWVLRFAPLIPEGATVLDYACGSGRHARGLAARGLQVHAVDRDPDAIRSLAGVPGVQARRLELEDDDWPLQGETFDAVVVTNYLHRARFDALLGLVRAGGLFIYETFMIGNERFGKPSNPAFLLRPGELLERVGAGWTVIAFEQGETAVPRSAVVQRICAVKATTIPRLP